VAQAARQRNPRGQGQLLRDQLIEATAHLLATMDRPETLTLRQVAREVGVAPASIYSHFPDLTALTAHVLKLRYDELGSLMNEAAAATASPLAELVARCTAYVRWGVGHPGEYRTVIGGAMPEHMGPLNAHDAGEELLNALARTLAAARRPGGEPTTAEEQWRAGLILWTGLHGLVSLYNSHGNLPWPALDDLLAHLLALHADRAVTEIKNLMPGRTTGKDSPAGLPDCLD
jgi:AcrR family transcriptional regulator